jgi:hypothetical protein
MNPGTQSGSGCSFGQFMVDQRPVFDNSVRRRKRPRRENQVLSRKGIIRPDKRRKAKYL